MGALLKEDVVSYVMMNVVLEGIAFFVIVVVLREDCVMGRLAKEGFVLVQIVKEFYWM